MPKLDIVINSICYTIPVLFVFVTISILASMVSIEFDVTPPPPKELDPFIVAENYVQDGNLHGALLEYSEIILDSPSEEIAWHQKGKILNRLNMCNESLFHYEEYLDRFPQSLRGLEGYEIAKNCQK